MAHIIVLFLKIYVSLDYTKILNILDPGIRFPMRTHTQESLRIVFFFFFPLFFLLCSFFKMDDSGADVFFWCKFERVLEAG